MLTDCLPSARRAFEGVERTEVACVGWVTGVDRHPLIGVLSLSTSII